MQRVSTNRGNDDMQYYLRQKEVQLNRAENAMGNQQRIQNLRDDPVGAAHSTRYQSYLFRLEQFRENVDNSQSQMRIAEGFMQEANNVLQRVSELSIQGANGTYAKDDLQKMGVEVNELLNELIQLANAKSADGVSVFAGTRIDVPAFRSQTGRVPGADGAVITGVEYIGSIGTNQAEISENAFMTPQFAGNKVFWAENQSIFSPVDAQNFQVQADSSILIDGKEIALKTGDTVHGVISRINSADLAVKARLDPVTNGLIMETTMPHQLWIQEGPGGSVLKDLGVLSGDQSRPPHNLSPDARRFGGSMFDVVINLRDAMLTGDQEALGGRSLLGVRQAQNNLLTNIADLGAKDSRLDLTGKTLDYENEQVTGNNAKILDLDVTQGITELKMLEYTHKAALGAAGKVLKPGLIEFLR